MALSIFDFKVCKERMVFITKYGLVFLPTQIHFSIVGRVTCPGSTLTNSLGKQLFEPSTCTWSGRAHRNRGKFVCQSASNKYSSRIFFFYFWVGRYGKLLALKENSEFCFPSTLKIPFIPFNDCFAPGKQNSLLSLRPEMKWLMTLK